MSNYLIYLAIVLTAIVVVTRYRQQRDRQLLADEVKKRGGELLQLTRVKKGSPFPDTSRGWWAWQVSWKSGAGDQISWALTTREGLGEWRD